MQVARSQSGKTQNISCLLHQLPLMVSTRSGTAANRQRQPASTAAGTAAASALSCQLTEAAVLSAVEARRADILHHAATVTPNLLLGWLKQDLGVPEGDEAALEELRRHSGAAKRRAVELLEEQGQMPASDEPACAADLPPDLLPSVFLWLDHDSLFCALQVSQTWRAAGAPAGDLWQQMCTSRGWVPPQHQQQQQEQQQHQQQPQEQPHQHAQHQEQGQPLQQQQQRQRQRQPQAQPQPPQQQQPPASLGRGHAGPGANAATAAPVAATSPSSGQSTPPAAPDWRQIYRQHYVTTCYDCFQPTSRRTLMAGSLRLRLCRPCSAGYDSPRPGQRLVSSSTAKWQCCLQDADLAGLLYCVEPNPANPSFEPMRLYRRLDVRHVAVARRGSWEAVQAEHRRRITRS